MSVIFLGATIYSFTWNFSMESGAEITFKEQVNLFPISAAKISQVKIEQSVPLQITTPVSPFYLKIPVLGVEAPIIFEATVSENRIYSALEKGVVHYAETPAPGSSGTSVIIGHSSAYPWYQGKYGYIFSRLSELHQGDIIIVKKNNETLSYRVTKTLIFSPKDNNDYELNELGSTEGSSLVLMTCWPNGTNAKRIAVRADLI